MARLRVGDIEIDGDRVTIHGDQGASAGSPAVPHRSVRDAPSDGASLAAIPGSPRVLTVAGASVALLGVVWMVLTPESSGLFRYVLSGGALTFFGLGAAVLGVAKHLTRRRLAAELDRAERRRLEPVRARLRHELGDEATVNTVEHLVARTGFSEADIVRALRWMREAGDVREELNLDTGEWYYVLGDEGAADSLRVGDLDERAMALEERSR
ncbi:MAG: hypothetical protein ACQEXJ_19605 [Myxococcota bacterium]